MGEGSFFLLRVGSASGPFGGLLSIVGKGCTGYGCVKMSNAAGEQRACVSDNPFGSAPEWIHNVRLADWRS